MTTLVRSSLGLLIAFALVLLVMWAVPKFPVLPCGIVLPAYGAKPAIMGGIKLFDQASVPITAEPIGSITMMYHTASQEADSQRIFFESVSRLATRAGGNGVVLNQFFFIPASAASGPALYFRGGVVLTH